MSAHVQDLKRLLNQARVGLIGASDAGIKSALFDVFHVFFNDSSSWQQLVSFGVLNGVFQYDVTPDVGQIIRLVGVKDQQNIPQPALMQGLGTIILQNAPNAVTTPLNYTATVVLNVALPNEKTDLPAIPDWVLPVFAPGILSGLLGKMMLEANKSYSNASQGMLHMKEFRDVVNRARVATLRANTFGAQAWTFPQSFRTRNQRSGNIGTDQRF